MSEVTTRTQYNLVLSASAVPAPRICIMVYTPASVQALTPPSPLTTLKLSCYKAPLTAYPLSVEWETGLHKTLSREQFLTEISKLPPRHLYCAELHGPQRFHQVAITTDYTARGYVASGKPLTESLVHGRQYAGLFYSSEFPEGRFMFQNWTYPLSPGMRGIPARAVEELHIREGTYLQSPVKADFLVIHSPAKRALFVTCQLVACQLSNASNLTQSS